MTSERARSNAKRSRALPGAAQDRVVQTTHFPNDDLITIYIQHRRAVDWGPGTARIRTGQLRQLAEDMAPTPLVAVSEEQLLAWRLGLTGEPETISSKVAAARGLYRWMAVRARPRLRVDDPAAILDYPSIPERLPRPMPENQFVLALACAATDPQMYAWIGLGGCCGLRCCEMATLKTGDVEHLASGCGLLHVTGKGGKQRTVPAGEPLMDALAPFLSGTRGPVFRRPSDGKAHTPNRVSELINAFLRGIGIDKTAHTLRHRFGTDYHALDPDIFRQAGLMGHSSVDMTRRYTQVSPDEAVRHINQLTQRRMSHRSLGRVA